MVKLWQSRSIDAIGNATKHLSMALLNRGEMKSALAQVVSFCVHDNSPAKKIMRGNIPYIFDSWANPVVHLQLRKSSMT